MVIDAIEFRSQPTVTEAHQFILSIELMAKSYSATYRSIQQACKKLLILDPTYIPRLNSTTGELLDFIDLCLNELRRIRDDRKQQQSIKSAFLSWYVLALQMRMVWLGLKFEAFDLEYEINPKMNSYCPIDEDYRLLSQLHSFCFYSSIWTGNYGGFSSFPCWDDMPDCHIAMPDVPSFLYPDPTQALLSNQPENYQRDYSKGIQFAVQNKCTTDTLNGLSRLFGLDFPSNGARDAFEDVQIGASRYADVRIPHFSEYELVDCLLSACNG